ncbi:MAG: homoserine O-succinyltransferase [Deltaproteobacteria bacterium]|nr:homoserine O-succinyltransferase [Deltaproteobacteria bacterium]
MTIVTANNFHAKAALEKKGVYCITEEQALHQDIRGLRIGILNVMPEVAEYEESVLYTLGRTLIHIHPVWIRLESQQYRDTHLDHIEREYVSFDEAVKDRHLDGLIITGAPVETIPFEEVRYWDEIVKILEYAKTNIASTMGICWGGLALGKIMGIDKVPYTEKLFGVFKAQNMDRNHRITGRLDDEFWTPQSRYAGIKDEILEAKAKEGVVNLLAYSQDAGYTIFESSDHRFIAHLGHPEYEADRLVKEYIRDRDKGLTDVVRPVNVNINRPINIWRGHCHEFYGQWIKYVYETTPY